MYIVSTTMTRPIFWCKNYPNRSTTSFTIAMRLQNGENNQNLRKKRDFTKTIAQSAFFQILIWNFQNINIACRSSVSEIYWSLWRLLFEILAFKHQIIVISVHILLFACLKFIFTFHTTLWNYILELCNAKSDVLPFKSLKSVVSTLFYRCLREPTAPKWICVRGFWTRVSRRISIALLKMRNGVCFDGRGPYIGKFTNSIPYGNGVCKFSKTSIRTDRECE